MTTLYLASGSPRRQELLTQLGFSFEQVVPGIEENGVFRKARSSMLFGWRAKRRRLAWRWFPVICRCWARIR